MIYLDPNINTVEQVLDIQARALSLLGSINISWSSEGVSLSRSPQSQTDIKLLLVECRRFLKAAQPDLFGRRVTQIILSPQ